MVSVTASASFEAVLEQLATKGLHRVYVTDLEGKPTSVITLTDVLRKVGAGVRLASAGREMACDGCTNSCCT